MNLIFPEIPFDNGHVHYRGDVVDLTVVMEDSSLQTRGRRLSIDVDSQA